MTGGGRDPKVSFRLPEELLETIDDVCEEYDVGRSRFLRMSTENAVETQLDALGVEARISKLRQEIIDFGQPIDHAGGFAGRCADAFRERFENGYGPKWLAAKAENYRREAEMLEEEVVKHPDAPPIEDGELVEEVERELHHALQAWELSDWLDRYTNPYERYEGVESGKKGREFAVNLLRDAIRLDRDLDPLRSVLGDRRVDGDDLDQRADEFLPPDVEREDVAQAARQLADQGVDPEDLAAPDLDMLEGFDLESEDAVPVDVDAPSVEAAADGGSDEAIVAYSDEQDGEQRSAETEHGNMDQDNPTRTEIVEQLSEFYQDLGGGPKARQALTSKLTDPDDHNQELQAAVERNGWDVDELVEDAVITAQVETGEVEA